MNDICKLNDTELEAVSGGMTCQAAKVVADIHHLTADALRGLGRPVQAAYYDGMAMGGLSGACGY